MARATAVIVLCSAVLLNPTRSHANDASIVLARKAVAEQAKQQADTPVHPGVPGKQPFWNNYSRKFIYAPAFDFAAVEGATSYRFTARSGADLETYTFDAATPWRDLAPIWGKLPVGMVELTVDAMKGDQVLKAAGSRRFYKDSPFQGPYRTPVLEYRQSARKLLEYTMSQPFITHWLETGKPDPEFGLYSYPSKNIGAVIEAMTLAIKTDLSNKQDARKIAERAAAFLMKTSLPADSPLAYFPLTYDTRYVKKPAHAAVKWNGQIMMFYPAEVGLQYLDFYRVTRDSALLEAAKRIADTYVRTQLPSGTWPINVNITTGKPANTQLCIPVHVVRFLHELVVKDGLQEYAKPCQAALDWIMANPARTFDWAGQFEDIDQDKPPYANLSARAAALYFAIYLMENHADDAAKMSLSRELLRFSEDQFMVWERPAPGLRPDLFDFRAGHAVLDDRKTGDTSTWITPVTLEQYNYYVPIGTSGSVALEAWLAAWRIDHRDLDLAKALSFANNLTYLQLLHGDGGIPTHWAVPRRGCGGWINNLASQARALLAVADAMEGKTVLVSEAEGRACSHTAAGTPCPYADLGFQCPLTLSSSSQPETTQADE